MNRTIVTLLILAVLTVAALLVLRQHAAGSPRAVAITQRG
jgi:hypothetical protein